MQLSQKELGKLCSDPQSGFSWVTSEEVMALPPRFQDNIGRGIREQLNAKIGFVCDRFEGAIMGYSKVRLLGEQGRIMDDSPFLIVKVRVDFVVFQPRIGAILQGEVNKIGKDHMGLVVYGHFNVSIHLAGTKPKAMNKGDVCSFVVTRVHTHRGLLSMVGKMV